MLDLRLPDDHPNCRLATAYVVDPIIRETLAVLELPLHVRNRRYLDGVLDPL